MSLFNSREVPAFAGMTFFLVNKEIPAFAGIERRKRVKNDEVLLLIFCHYIFGKEE